METLYISEKTDAFYLARWLKIKGKITEREMRDYSNKPRKELLTIAHDFGFAIKERERSKRVFLPSKAELFD